MALRVSQALDRHILPSLDRLAAAGVHGETLSRYLTSGARRYAAVHGTNATDFPVFLLGLALKWAQRTPGAGDHLPAREEIDALIDTASILPATSPEGAMAAFSEGVVWGRYIREGRHDYEVSPGLTQRLLATEVRGVQGKFLRLPFPCLTVKLDPAAFDGYVEVLVSEQTLHESMPAPRNADGTMKFLTFFFNRGGHFADGKFGTARGKVLTLRVLGEDDLSEQIERNTDRMSSIGARVARFVTNLVLYLSWPDTGDEPEIRHNPEWLALREKIKTLTGYKKERAKERLKELSPERRLYVGAKVPFLTGGESAVSGGGDKLLVRTLVSGHWKQQPCGPRNSERKLIRIEPFWRGPVDGALSSPVRKVS
jgi:hypothetical protein